MNPKGSLSRLTDIWRAGVNDVLERLEDPEKMARQYGRDLEYAVEQTVAALAQAKVSVRTLEKKKATADQGIATWARQAEEAMAAGDEAGARAGLERKAVCQRQADDIAAALAESQETVETLQLELEKLRARLAEAQNRQGALAARYRAARGQGRVGEDPLAAKPPLGADAVAQWERANEKVEAAEIEAELHRQMAGQGPADHGREEAAKRAAQVDAELAQLRDKVKKTEK